METLIADSNIGLPESFNYTQKNNSISFQEPITEKFDFQYAPLDNPCEFVHSLKEAKGPEKSLMNFKKGTTTLGFRFQGGVLLAVDSRASQGSFDASETVRKIIEINEFLLGTMAGGAADCQFWEQYLAIQCRKYQLQHGERVSVAAASRILINILYGYKNQGLSVGCMLAGWDNQGPQLYYLDNDGSRIKGDLFSVGSGSTYAYGVLDSHYKWDLSLKEAVELGKRAIYHATFRDAGSGGVVRVYHVHQGGWDIIHDGLDVNTLHYEFATEKNMDGSEDQVGQKLL
ncbi:proteasome subunit beta type, putative [Ichthyophthirius multifiliis]|uniref:Proteasome subunit beta n=1 Tax=Ichthyophthirius multifiliis TaxID=5932 RepID=G0R0I7_ICHMU|nr:proteasome subunit beta type, putative [Ichthyophthirius multifiliis]EGR29012.1 proteasome subunit beta type, putative [Ichthyophthirius multifiliis]|eukprot:XP_004030248.1 proteasome subunit beta type, putative [Ichthyophthirius multifiliis]